MAERSTVQKVLGIAQYEARWVARSFMVKLTARGILPCSNYEAQLEQRPERVIPPMWNMVFFQEDYCEKAIRSFEKEVFILNAVNAQTISVTDAAGEHQIPIREHLPAAENNSAMTTAIDADEYIVYAKLPKSNDSHKGCIIVPADFLVTAVHYRAFGPASKDDCEAFLLKNCNYEADLVSELSGEIPWPLLTE